MEARSVRVKVTENLSKEARTGEIVITGVEDKTLREVITVNQEGFAYTINTTLSEGDYHDARSHRFSFSVSCLLPLEVETIAPVEKVEGDIFRIPANYTSGALGQGNILVKYNGTLIESVPVYYSAPTTPEIQVAEINVTTDAGKASVDIKNNTDIDYQILSGADWCQIENIDTHTGTATDVWTFALAENTSVSGRTATIRFKAGDFWEGTATIVQAGKANDETGTSATVEIPAGGSLDEVLGDNAMDIGDLTMSGEADGADIATIRRMVTEGKLSALDISKTDIKKDLINSYYVEGANLYRPTKTTEDNMIGHWLFYKSHLKEIAVPTNLQHIGYKAFAESELESITLPEGMLTMEESAFYRCNSLRSATLPSTLKEIPKYAFEVCTVLEEVTLPEGIRSIGDYAFAPSEAYYANSCLRKINLPSTLESLGTRCLMTSKLTDVTVPASVKYMGEGIFMESRSLNKVRFLCEADTLPAWTLQNVLNLMEIEFPKGLKVIGPRALDHAGLPNLVIPEGVTTLMECSLNGSGYLSLVLPESLEEIGAFALGYQSRVSSFTIPRNVKKIGNKAFDGACYFKALHMKCPTPPEHDGEIFFRTFKYADCTLYVPAGSKAAYEADSYWLKFKEIIEE